jgi:hypothetical protein
MAGKKAPKVKLRDDPNAMDWRYVKILNDASALFSDRLEFCRQGGILRTKSGMRGVWRSGKPTEAEREAAKQALRPFKDSEEASCPCCGRTFLIPSEYVSVRDHGVCCMCKHFLDDKLEGVVQERSPTLAEVNTLGNDLRWAEVRVLRDELARISP